MSYTNDGILLKCGTDGIITNILFNTIFYDTEKVKGKLLIDLFDKHFVGKALDFLVEIRKSTATFGWELQLKSEYSEKPLFFGGALIENDITIFGSHSKVDFTKFFNEMMLINNEQVNRIRALEKAQHQNQNEPNNSASYFLDELSRLNNELVDTQRELTKKNIELEELNKLKNKFLGMAAHDLRNPLGHIIHYSEFLEEEKSSFNEEQIEFLTEIKASSWFMLNLITELLDISAIESGKVNLKYESVDLVALINRTIHLNRSIADKKEIKLHLKSNKESIELALDRGKIEQVITNLITNAIKYSYCGSEVFVEINLSANGETVTSVKDNGQGIPEKELNLLFKPFQKTSIRSTNGEKSTGLGLFIVKRIVEAHNGKIWVESLFGKGSTFYFSLPPIN
jgi:signal transduction histidine kinase